MSFNKLCMSKCSKIEQIPEVVAYACNPSTQEAEAKGLPQLRGQTRLHSESKTSLNYISIPCLKKRKKKRAEWARVGNVCNPSVWEAKEGGFS